MKTFWMRKALFFVLMAALALIIFGGLVMTLWNALLPALFKVPAISFGQAIGILVLSRLLFGGFRCGCGGPGSHWRHKMREKWAQMTPEERERFRQEWQKRCGRFGRKWGTSDTDIPPTEPLQ